MSSATEPRNDRPIATERFAVVDVETSGLEPSRHHLLQVGVVIVTGDGTVVDRWSSLVGPGWKLWRGVGPTHVHGLRRRDVWRAPTAAVVMPQLAARISGCRFVGHNAPFDLAFLRRAAAAAGVMLPISEPLCTLRMSRALDPDRTMSHRLGDLCERYGIELVDAHDALADAEATAALLPHMFAAHSLTTVDQLDGVFVVS